MLFLMKAEAQNCTLSLGIDKNYIVGSAYNIQPGDVVCFEPGTKDFIQLKDIHGTADKPITFINKGGVILINTDHYFGIKIGNCSHIIFRGDGSSKEDYGFQIKKVTGGAGVSVDDKSTDVEISHIEISNTAIGGLYAKTDPTCDNYQDVDRDHFTMYNFSFHDSYIHDVADEGMYIGNSHYSGYTLTGCSTFVYPHTLRGVKIYNNIVENTGWDGIQVSSADSGCQIYNNRIHFDSQSEAPGQMSGMLIGGGSKCSVYNNQITDGKGDGIDVFGLGNMEIFNNLIVNAGMNYQAGDPTKLKHGIYVGTVTTEQNAVLGIYNNTIINPKSFGITLTNTQIYKNRIINNLITEPGKFEENGDGAFINSNISETRFEKYNNFKTNDNQEVHFVSFNSGNYDLQGDSPAVNFGIDLTSEGITFDILNRDRPFHQYFDAGAYESHDPNANVALHQASDVQVFEAFPNPAQTQFTICLQVNHSQQIDLKLFNSNGQELYTETLKASGGLLQTFPVKLIHATPGIYLLRLTSFNGTSSKIIMLK
jgi:hypothetical protein